MPARGMPFVLAPFALVRFVRFVRFVGFVRFVRFVVPARSVGSGQGGGGGMRMVLGGRGGR